MRACIYRCSPSFLNKQFDNIIEKTRFLSMSFAISSILILLLFFTVNSTAQDNNNCASSSCGDIRISYPFRLTSSPRSCGYDDPSFQLECQNNQTISKAKSARYIVQDINYDSYTMRVVDPSINRANLSSCPAYSNDYDSWPSIISIYFFELNRPVSFIYCLAAVNSSKYVEAPFCGNRSSIFSNSSQIYSYIMEGDRTTLSDVEESCTVDRVVWTSASRVLSDNSSLASIYDDLGYGVELSWFRALCGDCERSDGYCSLEGNRITCKHYCMEDTPVSERSFKCQLEYWGIIVGAYGMIAYGGLMALRFLIGFAFLMVLVVLKWRKRHLPI